MGIISDERAKSNRIDSLQIVRAIAILGIFSAHSGLTQLGAWGVSVFLVLSGFVMTYAYFERELVCSPKSNLLFAWRKISKLYPLHIVMMLLALLNAVRALAPEFSRSGIAVLGGKTILNITMLQAWIPSGYIYFSLNGVAWYLSVCMFIYFMFPYVLRYIRKLTVKSAIATISTVYLVQTLVGYLAKFVTLPGYRFENFPKWVIYIFPLFRWGDFLIGCGIAVIFMKKTISINKIAATLLEASTFVLIYVSQYIYVNQLGTFGTEWFRYTMLFTPSTILLILLFASHRGMISNLLVCRPLLYIAEISAYIFLIHQVAITYQGILAGEVLKVAMPAWLMVGMELAVTALLAEVYRRWERRFE